MSERRLELRAAQLEEIFAHCRCGAPNEACGLLSGREGRISRVWPTGNLLASPTEYAVPPEEQLAVVRAIWAAGEDLVGIFHSHPLTPAYPSARDLAQAYYPEVVYLIVSLAPGESVRAFAIDRGTVAPVDLVVLEERPGRPGRKKGGRPDD
jgi:proteasome lid subunit RPN8/RPN11